MTGTQLSEEHVQKILDEEGLDYTVADVTEGYITLWEETGFGKVPGKTFESFDEFKDWARNYDGAD